MSEAPVNHKAGLSAHDTVRAELARGDAVLATIQPVLGHLLASDDHSLFSDQIVARVRAMLADVTRQLLEMQGGGEPVDPAALTPSESDRVFASLAGHSAFLGHAHALAVEWQLIERIEARNAIDPVLSPLLQALIASPDARMASLAMAVLAAQARFCQQQRRMELPLRELPGDLLHAALLTRRRHTSAADDVPVKPAEQAIRASYDESRTRIGLLSRLVTGMGNGALAALRLDHAGVVIFFTALALASRQHRGMAVISVNPDQSMRLALSLRSAGLKPAAVAEQCHYLLPDLELLVGFDQLRVDDARALLAQSHPNPT